VIGLLALTCLLLVQSGEIPDGVPVPEVTRNLLLRLLAAGAAIGLLFAALRVAPARARIQLLALAAIVCWADLHWHQPNLHPTIDANWYRQPNPALNSLSPEARAGLRRMQPSRSRQEQNLFAVNAGLLDAFKLARVSLFNDWNLVEGAAKMNGFYSLWLPAQRKIAEALSRDPEDLPGGMADFFGVEYVSPTENTLEWIHRPTAAPLVQAGLALRPASDPLAALTAPDFDGARVALYEADEPAPFKPLPAAAATVTNHFISAHEIAFTVTSPAETIATVAVTHHPNWRASIDGEPAPLLRVNLGAQAVIVPAGEHRVELRYVDRAFSLGRWITLAALCVVAWRWRAIRREDAANG